jgi:putative nucleotidyltransferase with HDIG domain
MKLPWNAPEKPEKPLKSGDANLHLAADTPAAGAKAPARQRLYVWAKSPEQRHLIEGLFSREHWILLPTSLQGPELIKLIRGNKPAGIIFHQGEGMQTVVESLQLLEAECVECPRLVVCAEGGQEAFRDWQGVPPVVLRESAQPAEIEEKLARAIALNQWLAQPAMRSVLPRLSSIPTLPAAHQRVVEALKDPNFSVDDVARLMAGDIALTTNLFKLVNSAAFGLSHPVNTVAEAITQIGVERVQTMVMSAWAFKFIDEETCAGFHPAREWEHAMTVAQAAQELAKELGQPPSVREAAFTAGVLHDLGKLLLAANAPEAYALILADAAESNRPLWQVEKEGLGFSHAEIGACMLGVWGTALPIVEAVAWHHQPSLASNQRLSPLTLVHLANCKARGLEPDALQSGMAHGI